VQEVEPGSFALQVVLPAVTTYGPLTASVRPLAACRPRLLIVTVNAALVVPTGVAGNCNSVTFDCNTIAGVPVPVTVTVAVGGIALLAITVSVALSTPTTDGP
jgi:hypothetical protein